MGIIKNWVMKTGQKAADTVASLSQLSPAQLSKIQMQKDQYMSEKPDPNDAQAVELTARLLAENGVEIFNSYLSQIKQLYLPLDPTAEYGREFDPYFNIRYFNITKWVTNKEENSLEKLVNVYAVLSNQDCNIALVFNRTKEKSNVYLAVVNNMNRKDNYEIEGLANRIKSAIQGNFPGSEIGIDGKGMAEKGRIQCLVDSRNSSVAIASNVPTEKSEKFISQTIEKLLDGYVPSCKNEEYTIVLLATPVTDVEERKQELSRIYSGLVPYSQWSTNYTYTESDSTTGMAIIGVNIGASAGIQRGTNQGLTENTAQTNSEGETTADTINEMEGSNQNITDTKSENTMITDSTSDTITNSKGTNQSTATSLGTTSSVTNSSGSGTSYVETVSSNKTITDSEGYSAQAGGGLPFINASAGYTNNTATAIGSGKSTANGTTTSLSQALMEGTSEVNTATTGTSTSYAISAMTGHSTAAGVGTALAQSVGSSFAKTVGRTLTSSTGRAITNGMAKAVGTARNTSFGANIGANFARSSSVTVTIGKNEGITQNYCNFEIMHALDILKEQMKRYETGTALGMWDFAAYVLSEDYTMADNVAHSYLALTQGEESYMSDCAVNLWRNDIESDKNKAREICRYLLDLRHPQFGMSPDLVKMDSTFLIYPSAVTATATLSGKELAYSLNFPRKSIAGLPVLECAEFGRNVVSYNSYMDDDLLHLGTIFHMNHQEKTPVFLNKNAMASHTFITGSTGSGKSNTIYKILDAALEKGINFLVIEPAKGEYKNVFGNREDVKVFGTNPAMTDLLKINPFSFNEKMHIFEHLDRLVEIFCVCWPMYAAMPAVLKSAIEKSYEDCGWDLIDSTNKYGKDFFPSFKDVARNIKTIIDSSEYDTENKGAYKGSLLTRLQSLSNGINGLIFSEDEFDEDVLFSENIIVDLSRIGSTETKALIMGMLILKQQEYHLSGISKMNSVLKHLTVLEEAHNLLRRTSSEQISEGGNLIGKSVEMIANAIAEMRTYGEGFIIADQAPGLLDMATIRNTNTKIIMRLPDQGDRELVGKACNLNDLQIKELAKIPCGVGAIYQNDWLQPVLCKVEKHNYMEHSYIYNRPMKLKTEANIEKKVKIMEILSKGLSINDEAFTSEIIEDLNMLKLESYVKALILKTLSDPPKEPRMTKFAPIVASLFPEIVMSIKNSYTESNDPKEWTNNAETTLNQLMKTTLEDQTRRDIIQASVTYYFLNENNNIHDLQRWSEEGRLR